MESGISHPRIMVQMGFSLEEIIGTFSIPDTGMMTAMLLLAKETGLWARPKSWQGQERAITWGTGPQEQCWLLVPSRRGGLPVILPSPEELLECWEVVGPESVLKGD